MIQYMYVQGYIKNKLRITSLIYGEVAEAYDAWKKKKDDLNEELADIAVYLMGLSEMLGFELADEIEKKVSKNEKRLYKNIDGFNVRISGLY